VLAILETMKSEGFIVDVHDEGEFWETRDESILLKSISDYNNLIAAVFGALKDEHGDNIQSPIKDFPNVEHLEADGIKKLNNISGYLNSLQQIVNSVKKEVANNEN